MRNAMQSSRVLLIAVVALGVAMSAWGQTTDTGAFASLSPGDQKIARALFEAQTTNGTATPLTLDQIAAKKHGHRWGEVFKEMKTQGLVTDKDLGQVVKGFERQHPEVAAKPDKVNKPDKPEKIDRMDKPERPEKPGR